MLRSILCVLLNQAHTSHRPVHAWFLKIASVHECMYACMCVCPPPRLPLTNGVMWHDMDPYDWLSKLYSFHMAAIVSMVRGHGLSIVAHCRNQLN